MELKFLASYILVLIALFYSYKQDLGLEKSLFLNSIRAFLQLLVLGYVLVFIFKLDKVYELIAVLFFMVLFASFTGERRTNLKKGGFLTAFLSILTSSFIVIFSLIIIQIISLKPNEIIPVGGMVIGNSLNVYTLFVDRIKGEIKNSIDIIENKIALGATLKQAIQDQVKNSVKASLIPVINTLQTVGIIHIPGVTTGMLLAGADPLEAVSYQLVIMYMMVAVSLFTAVFTNTFLMNIYLREKIRF